MKSMERDRKWLVLFFIAIMAELAFLGIVAGRCLTKERYAVCYDKQEELPIEGNSGCSLYKGTWLITVEYMTEEPAYCQAAATVSTGLYRGDKVVLTEKEQQKTIEFELEEDTKNFYLCISGDNEEQPADVYVKSVRIQETRRMDARNCILLLFLFLCADVFFLAMRKRIWGRLELEQKQVFFGLAAIVTVSSIPLFVNYLVGEHDIAFHLMRIQGLAEGLKDGCFPVKMQQAWINGYGYPVSVMYGDLLLYIPAVLRCVGFSLQDAYKIYVLFINVITAGSSYYAVKHMSGNRKLGLIGAALYMLSLYRITDIYLRSAVGEYSAMAFFPLVFLGFHLLFDEEVIEKKRGIFCLVIGYTGILQSHSLSFAMIILFSMLYVLAHIKALWKNLWTLMKTAVVTILLNLCFLVPMIDYMLNQDMLLTENSSTDNMQEYGIFVAQLFQTYPSGAILSAPLNQGVSADMLLTTGIPLICVLVIFLWEIVCYGGRLKEKNRKYDWKEQIIYAVMMGLTLTMSCWFFPWEAIRETPVIGAMLTPFQFAWRFLLMATVAGTLLSGYVLRNLRYLVSVEWKRIVVVILCVLTVWSAIDVNGYILSRQRVYMVTGISAIDPMAALIGREYLPEGVEIDLYNTQVEPGGGVQLKSAEKDNRHLLISVVNKQKAESKITVPYMAYRGYVAIDSASHEQFETMANEETFALEVILPAGYEGEIDVYFREPAIWRIAEGISFLTVLFLIGKCGVASGRKKNKYERKDVPDETIESE